LINAKAIYYILVFLGLWWIIHIYEGATKLEQANKACDPFYWVGSFSEKHIVSGFTTSESDTYKYSQEMGSDLGQACFWASARLFKAVNPNWNYEDTQIFNTNEQELRRRNMKKNASAAVKNK